MNGYCKALRKKRGLVMKLLQMLAVPLFAIGVVLVPLLGPIGRRLAGALDFGVLRR